MAGWAAFLRSVAIPRQEELGKCLASLKESTHRRSNLRKSKSIVILDEASPFKKIRQCVFKPMTIIELPRIGADQTGTPRATKADQIKMRVHSACLTGGLSKLP